MGSTSSSHDIAQPSVDKADNLNANQKKKSKKRKQSTKLDQPLDSKPADTTPSHAPKQAATEELKAVMISYCRVNNEFLEQIKDILSTNCISSWNDTADITFGADYLSNIGQAIIDCKVFMYLITEESIKSKCCQDELALAYISNKLIIPVCKVKPQELFPRMDTGMKLQLARMKWVVFDEPEKFVARSSAMVESIKAHIASSQETSKSGMNRQQTESLLRTISMPGSSEQDEAEDEKFMATFWERHYQEQTCVCWFGFVEKFTEEYEKEIEMIFQETKNKVWLISILHNELEITNNEIYKVHYDAFCMSSEGRQPFWVRVQEYAVESYSIREVFNMESSVRVEAIEHLGKFKTPPVMNALLDLLKDADNNVKAVAAISLARTETDSADHLSQLTVILDDKDRLVRESGCLALGHLKAQLAVPKLVHLWRNDFISSVRDAAELALDQIGGEEANKAMHMTKVLTDEIKQLMAS